MMLLTKTGGGLMAAAGAGDGWILEGMATTRERDLQGDYVAPGAYRQMLKETGGVIPLLWAHDASLPPVGRTTAMVETDAGLYFRGRLSPTRMGTDIKTLLQDGALGSCSIGFNLRASHPITMDGKRTRSLDDIDLKEISIVTWGAQRGANVALLDAGKTAHARLLLAIGRYEFHKARGYVPQWVAREYLPALEMDLKRALAEL